MKFWQSLFLCEGDQIIEATKIADEVGFDGALVSDHLLHIEEQTSTYLYSADGKPWLMIVLSSATTGRPSASARATSGRIASGVVDRLIGLPRRRSA